MTTVSDVMTRGVRSMAPGDSVVLAAQAMDELNVGVIPVCEGPRLVGVVTDRDIVVRGVAQDRDLAQTLLSDVMSGHVRTVREHDDIDEVLAEMARSQIRRMPVVDAQDRLVGIVSLGDLAAKTHGDELDLAHSLGDISEPAAPDRSHQSHASGPAGGGAASSRGQRQPG
ncbi:MAG TPA: CBS domain-containing protein [Ramlibacter sp.]|nr:CBS domain-containing protein [Ramlibacter sp.]